MYSLMKENDKTRYNVKEFTADTIDDMYDIPTTELWQGSTCLIIDQGTVYMLNSEKEWKQL